MTLPVLRVIFTGSRRWRDRQAVSLALHTVAVYAQHVAMRAEIVHGAHWEGLDQIVDEVAEGMGLARDSYPARWAELGTKAGPIRNGEMVDSRPTPGLCVAFPIGPEWSGTRDCVAKAHAAGIPVWLPELGGPLSEVLS